MRQARAGEVIRDDPRNVHPIVLNTRRFRWLTVTRPPAPLWQCHAVQGREGLWCLEWRLRQQPDNGGDHPFSPFRAPFLFRQEYRRARFPFSLPMMRSPRSGAARAHEARPLHACGLRLDRQSPTWTLPSRRLLPPHRYRCPSKRPIARRHAHPLLGLGKPRPGVPSGLPPWKPAPAAPPAAL